MERKLVYFLLCIFVSYSEARHENVTKTRIATEHPFFIRCETNNTEIKWTSVEWFLHNPQNLSQKKVILKWWVEDKSVTNISKKYKNEFFTNMLQLNLENGKYVVALPFRGAKLQHSGIYSCMYEEEKKESVGYKVHVQIHEQQFKITRCRDQENIHLQCSVFELDAKPETIKFDMVLSDQSIELKNHVYNKTRERDGVYNITGKMVVPLTQIGELPWHLGCEVTLEGQLPSMLKKSVKLTKQSISTINTIHCLPHLKMEKPLIWQKVGEKNLTFRCIFDIPHENRIRMIKWLYHNSKESGLMYEWKRKTGQLAGPNYANESFTSIEPVEYKRRNATTVSLKSATLNHTGNYTCEVTFSEYMESDTAVLVAYQLEAPNFTAIGCTDRKVYLECKASKVYPEPEGMSLSIYNPKSKSLEKINDVFPEIKIEGELYDIALKMTTAIDQPWFGESPNISCEVVLRMEFEIKETSWTKRKTYVTDSKGIRTNVCSPNVEIDKPEQWLKVGQTPVFQCKFDIPLQDKIESVVWIYRNISEENTLYKWEKKTNKSTITDRWKNEIRDESSLFPRLIEKRQTTTLKLKKATLDYTGNYSCRVNFVFAGRHSDTAMLVIYDLPIPHWFKAIRCRDNQTVGLECKAHNIRPKPQEVFFYAYNPSDNSWSRIATEVYIRITERNGSFEIGAKTIASTDLFSNITSKGKAKCEVILHRNIKETNVTDLAEPDTSSNNECSPNVRADKYRQWEKVGEDVVMRCTFDVPFRRHINSVEWIRQNVSGALITWEASTNTTINQSGKISDMSFVMTQNHTGRNAMTLRIENAKTTHSDNYTCRIHYGNSSQSHTLILVIYQLSPPFFTAVGCNNNNVRLECKANGVYPAPLDIVLSLYGPTHESQLKLNNVLLPENRSEEGLYDINAKIFTQLDQLMSDEESPIVTCDIILNRDPEIGARNLAKRTTYVVDSNGRRVDVCSPKVEMKPRLQWIKFGTGPVSMQCEFDIPLDDEVESVEWFHHRMSPPFNKPQIPIKPKYEDKLPQSSLIDDNNGRKFTILNLDTAKIEHTGRYFCKVNFRIAGNPSDNGDLVIYKIEKPYYFDITVDGEWDVLLECKAGDLFPRPLGIVFSTYDPVTNLKSELDKEPLTGIIPVGEFFNISAKMTIQVNESESLEYVCDVLLSEDPVILETTSNGSQNPSDDYTTSDTTGKAEIPTVVIIATGTVGALLFAGGLAYLLYVCICKRLCPPFARDEASKEDEEKK